MQSTSVIGSIESIEPMSLEKRFNILPDELEWKNNIAALDTP